MVAIWRVVVLPAAKAEMVEAQQWYEVQLPGLGRQFRSALDEQLARLRSDPLRFPVILDDIQRVRLTRFPYSLLFRIRNDVVGVMACFHARRDPKVWQSRRFST